MISSTLLRRLASSAVPGPRSRLPSSAKTLLVAGTAGQLLGLPRLPQNSVASSIKFYSSTSPKDPAASAAGSPEAVTKVETTSVGEASPEMASAEEPAAGSTPMTDAGVEPTTPAATTPTAAKESLIPVQSLAEQYLDLTDIPPPSSSKFPGNTTSARSRSNKSKSTNEKKRQALTRTMIIGGTLASLAAAAYQGREWDDEFEMMKLVGRTEDLDGVKLAQEGGLKGFYGRAKLRTEDVLDYLNKPAWEPLIPPPLPEPHYRPYTLIVDLDDLLVHSVWDRDNGWRTAKRPGVDYFLAYLSQFYEIVLFTTQPAYTAAPIVEKLDPYGAYIPWKLYRESTRYKNKSLIKDLSYLGRPLERTVILETNPLYTQLQPSNSIILSPWTGSKSDATSKELVALIPFLEALAIQGVKDVRTVIEHYKSKGEHIPTAYALAEAKLKEAAREKWESERQGREGKQAWASALFGSIGGGKTKDEPPELYIEQVRKHSQRMYLEEQKYWKDNAALIQKQMDDDREKQLKEMKGSLLGFMGIKTVETSESASTAP